MKCPYCGYEESKVIDSRSADDGERIRRRRECLKCSKTLHLNNLKTVIKLDYFYVFNLFSRYYIKIPIKLYHKRIIIQVKNYLQKYYNR